MNTIYMIQSGAYSERCERGFFLSQEEAIAAALCLMDSGKDYHSSDRDWMVLAAPVGTAAPRMTLVWQAWVAYEEEELEYY